MYTFVYILKFKNRPLETLCKDEFTLQGAVRWTLNFLTRIFGAKIFARFFPKL